MQHPANTIATAAGWLSRRLGRGGGTTLPGALITKWRPQAVRSMRCKLTDGALVISATNGKTTTARLIVSCLRSDGRTLVTNPSGANLMSGVASALLAAPAHPLVPALGVFEVDEAALPAIAEQLAPRVVLLMNLFRDQLDRYGELEHISERWLGMLQGLPPSTIVVLNADDPAVAHLGDAHPNIVWFGIDDTSRALTELPHAADARRCRRCGEPLIYDAVLVGHLGHWHCDACGWRRPTPSIAASAVTLHGLDTIDVDIATPGGPIAVRGLALPGLHNAYNATAAAAAALTLGVPVTRIGQALQSSQAAFGRSERLTITGRELVLLLIKNPAGANEIVRTLELDLEPLDLVLFLNDRTADGRDVSWIWDVDYEPLLPRIRTLTIAGDRAHDLALRFRYAGLDDSRMRVVPPTAEALDTALAGTADGRPLYALPTYTAMLGLREVLVARGVAQEFWRDR